MLNINLALVDDQILFRQGLSVLIRDVPGFSLVMEAEDGGDCLNKLAGMEVLPDILLVDMEMPGMDGMELNEVLQKRYPSIRMIVLSVHASERLIARMIDQAASGYLVKNCDKEELVMAVRTVFHTGYYMNARVLRAIQVASKPSRQSPKNINGIPVELSAREKEILVLICKELSAPEIAGRLYLSTRTVEGHRNNLLQKTGRRNTAGLVLFAVKYHLYEVEF